MSLNVREKVSKALDNLSWLKTNSHLLTGSEIVRIDAIERAAEWKMKAFDYLEAKRLKYDEPYAEIKDLQNRMGQTAKALRDYEAEKAWKQLVQEEDLIEQNARLLDEIYWLKTELSGLRQTQDITNRARGR